MNPYSRCIYIESSGLQCETWFEIDTENHTNRLCPNHRQIISPHTATNGSEEHKIKYIDLVNQTRAEVFKMSFEERAAHIAMLESELEKVKTKIAASRAVDREALDKLSEEERKELRKIKVANAVQDKTKTPTIKSDPVAYAMKKYNLSEAKAKELLGL